MERERSQGRLGAGNFVTISGSPGPNRSILVTDHGDAEAYVASIRNKRPARGQALQTSADLGGWLGRYHQVVEQSQVDSSPARPTDRSR